MPKASKMEKKAGSGLEKRVNKAQKAACGGNRWDPEDWVKALELYYEGYANGAVGLHLGRTDQAIRLITQQWREATGWAQSIKHRKVDPPLPALSRRGEASPQAAAAEAIPSSASPAGPSNMASGGEPGRSVSRGLTLDERTELASLLRGSEPSAPRERREAFSRLRAAVAVFMTPNKPPPARETASPAPGPAAGFTEPGPSVSDEVTAGEPREAASPVPGPAFGFTAINAPARVRVASPPAAPVSAPPVAPPAAPVLARAASPPAAPAPAPAASWGGMTLDAPAPWLLAVVEGPIQEFVQPLTGLPSPEEEAERAESSGPPMSCFRRLTLDAPAPSLPSPVEGRLQESVQPLIRLPSLAEALSTAPPPRPSSDEVDEGWGMMIRFSGEAHSHMREL
ncbi:hypothetical protein M409DRAFT_21384 [Zasmidium cellare ATCC 36951]|uniref:Uncharacterized protein n=1 Tax=Zasmidium cellare ATCC 36951 TaxID=1080233 RepID=A0A6A6CR73_ZASCE|nr:uncharacterized protein M409DRAFT_21384 [Zasmidium cellare ATCC 36951]KAF2168640.1 hypothetical protein M409DRAFT_21384 [Zasmidium cellare ATCC 36951]